MNIRYYIFDELKKDYQKFATYDMEYRGVISELAPTTTEKAYMTFYMREAKKEDSYIDKKTANRLHKIKENQDIFIKESDFIITGKVSRQELNEAKSRITNRKKDETIKQAINRVKEKRIRDKENGEHISGAVIADEIAERLKEGFEMPSSKEKRDAIATNLRKKRSTTTITNEISR